MELAPERYSARLSSEIRACMARQSMSQDHLAKAIGISRTALCRKLVGHSEFTVGELDAVARQFDLSVSELLYRVEAAA